MREQGHPMIEKWWAIEKLGFTHETAACAVPENQEFWDEGGHNKYNTVDLQLTSKGQKELLVQFVISLE